MIKVFDAFSGIGGFRSALERVGGFEFVAWCEIDKFAQKAYRAFMTLEVSNSMKISEILTPESLQTLICWSEGFPANRSRSAEQEKGLQMREAIFSLNLPEFLKVKDLAIFCLRTYPDSWGLIRGELSPKSLKRFANWGIAWNGVCITAPIIFPKSEREYILQDVLEIIVPAKYWLSEEATAKIAGKLSS